MKKFLVILLSVLTLAVSVPMTANAMPVLNSKNSVDVKGEISTLKKRRKRLQNYSKSNRKRCLEKSLLFNPFNKI